MFIDRERELAFLEEKWQEPKSQFIVLGGNVGLVKPSWSSSLSKTNPMCIFWLKTPMRRSNYTAFSNALGNFFKEPLLETRGFAGWEESFDFIKKKGKRLVLVIDEFPYLVFSNPGMLSLPEGLG